MVIYEDKIGLFVCFVIKEKIFKGEKVKMTKLINNKIILQ